MYQETCVRNSGKQIRRRRWSNSTALGEAEVLDRQGLRSRRASDPGLSRAHRLPLTRLGRDEQSRIAGSGGGGGGATYVFREEPPASGSGGAGQTRSNNAVPGPGEEPVFTPLIVAAGGGGLAIDETDQVRRIRTVTWRANHVHNSWTSSRTD